MRDIIPNPDDVAEFLEDLAMITSKEEERQELLDAAIRFRGLAKVAKADSEAA